MITRKVGYGLPNEVKELILDYMEHKKGIDGKVIKEVMVLPGTSKW